MKNSALLLDFHDRAHRSFALCLAHAGQLSAEQLDTELEGFGYPTVREQLQHAIGAERYWLSVVAGAMDASEDAADAATVEALEAFRARVAATTRTYLEGASDEELTARRAMTTYHGDAELVPMHVLMRTQVHLFHHIGQIAAMCRLLGHPLPPGGDFPLT
ncbi:MAG: DinB family protein [Planctomycetota bacterium]